MILEIHLSVRGERERETGREGKVTGKGGRERVKEK
jgi:hypothetical protein